MGLRMESEQGLRELAITLSQSDYRDVLWRLSFFTPTVQKVTVDLTDDQFRDCISLRGVVKPSDIATMWTKLRQEEDRIAQEENRDPETIYPDSPLAASTSRTFMLDEHDIAALREGLFG